MIGQLCRAYGYTPAQVRAMTLEDGRLLTEYLAFEAEERRGG